MPFSSTIEFYGWLKMDLDRVREILVVSQSQPFARDFYNATSQNLEMDEKEIGILLLNQLFQKNS